MMHVTISAMAAMAIGEVLGLGAEERGDTPRETKEGLSIYQFTMSTIEGEEVSLARYRDQVCLIVNVASR